MNIAEMFDQYISQVKSNHSESSHMDIGPGHFDYPHQDGHTDED